MVLVSMLTFAAYEEMLRIIIAVKIDYLCPSQQELQLKDVQNIEVQNIA